ncbi:MAG: hypothetical protein ACRD4F_07785 [Candidatus Angelobacter sp.]
MNGVPQGGNGEEVAASGDQAGRTRIARKCDTVCQGKLAHNAATAAAQTK